MHFLGYPKTPRYENISYFITEKLDGTNSAVIIDADGNVGAQSRNRIITPGKTTDNYGFAQWVEDNKEELRGLGMGHHYGEWWGHGIARGYGQTEKKFSLFRVWHEEIPSICTVVPQMGTDVQLALNYLKVIGSMAAPGYMRPEGLILTDSHYKTRYKIVVDK